MVTLQHLTGHQAKLVQSAIEVVEEDNTNLLEITLTARR